MHEKNLEGEEVDSINFSPAWISAVCIKGAWIKGEMHHILRHSMTCYPERESGRLSNAPQVSIRSAADAMKPVSLFGMAVIRIG